jgi:hypothetical protein
MSSVRIEEITPELAREYLANVAERRRDQWLRPARVEAYAADMKTGNWALNGAHPIMFDEDGRLYGGLLRMQAVVRSGVTVRMIVARDVNPDVLDAAMSNGQHRIRRLMQRIEKDEEKWNGR